MNAEIKDKVNLSYITHSVRAAQAVLQYGVGAMVDFPDQTLITSAPEYWNDTKRINDDRFAKALGVNYFALPTDISYARFPEWYFCPKCRKFQPISKWISEYRKKASPRSLESDIDMVKHMQCLNCYQDLVVARIVTICELGHINDFPWIKWVHKQSKKPICAEPALTFKTGASGTEGLEGLSISCSCKASASLKGAFDKDVFEKLDKENETTDFLCQGCHPHKNSTEKCVCYPRTVQRGSSSVYFPVIYNSLVIPPYANKLNIKIEQSKSFAECEAALSKLPDMKNMILEKYFSDWVKGIAFEIAASQSDVENILKRKWFEENSIEIDVSSVKYRAEEYEALSGELSATSDMLGDFSQEKMNPDDYNIPHIKSVSLVDKVRVVNALVGFSRINPIVDRTDPRFVNIKEDETRWYPAYEVRGEGIFIEFEQNKIDEWINNIHAVADRIAQINEKYALSFIGKNHPRRITPKLVMLHTLSHLLIKQLSFECGYSIASLSERIYCSDETDGKQMAGIFIYTASGDSEGTLGGLVRQGRPDALPRIFKKAISNAKTCSNDPVCILSRGQGRESLNLAACHACALLPETCCEERNAFLDRGLIVGTFENRDLSFFKDIF